MVNKRKVYMSTIRCLGMYKYISVVGCMGVYKYLYK